MGFKQYIFTIATLLAASQVVESGPIIGKPGIDKIPKGDNGFQYYIDSTTLYASAAPATRTTTYGPLYSQISTLLDGIATTTWGNWYPDATETATDTEDPYGQYAWSKLWEVTTFANFTRGIYSTTVSPTPIPTSSLALPPEDPVKGAFENLGIKFPKDFVLGVAGSAAQIEGALADEGRSPSILDIYGNTGGGLAPNYVTNENYYLYKQDIARLAAIGTEHYSFSIPWTRILPFAFPGTPINQLGIDHYDDLINTVLEYGMKPIITMTHFDSPLQFINDSIPLVYGDFLRGGYGREDFVEIFVNYGKILLTHFADRVPIWITFNEPIALVENALGVKNVVQATAQLHDFYHNELHGTGKIGIKFSGTFSFPEDPTNPAHVKAADTFNELSFDIFANPLFNGEDVPEAFKTTVLAQTPNLSWTPAELQQVKGKIDFFGVDPYTYQIVYPLSDSAQALCLANITDPYWPSCVNYSSTEQDGWAIGYRSQSYVYITPEHLRVQLNYIWQKWHAPILIAEFGFPEWREREKLLKDQLYDLDRSIYYRSFLTAALEASLYDGVNVMGALAWSFADNWEFGDYEQQFGLQVVNRTTQERFYKKSFFDFIGFVNQNREQH